MRCLQGDEMPLLPIDSPAPDFALKDQFGNVVSLASLLGSWTVIYFYPRDDTPGCTREACSFRDNFAGIRDAGATVIGVSADGAESHREFARKYKLPFSLLIDEGNQMARDYGAWGPKSMYGGTYDGIIRSTYILDPGGRVAKVWPKVKPDSHGSQVLDWLRSRAS